MIDRHTAELESAANDKSNSSRITTKVSPVARIVSNDACCNIFKILYNRANLGLIDVKTRETIIMARIME